MLKSSFVSVCVLGLTMLTAVYAATSNPSPDIIEVMPPPPLEINDFSVKPTMKVAPSRWGMLGDFRIDLEVTTLADVLKATGIGSIYHIGDAADSNYWLCYSLVRPHTGLRVWISSSGEMGGDQHAITDIQVMDLGSRLAATYPNTGCPLLPDTYEDVVFNHHIHIGSTMSDVLKTL